MNLKYKSVENRLRAQPTEQINIYIKQHLNNVKEIVYKQMHHKQRTQTRKM